MQAALIPPLPHLDLARGRDVHLLLSHIADDPAYQEFYRHQGRIGAHLILDNSAHENESGEGPRRLASLAKDLGAREIVLPDYLFKADETISLTSAAMKAVSSEGILDDTPVDHLMFVPQGQSVWSWRRCFYALVDEALKHGNWTYVIGVSKDYETFDGGLFDLLENDILPVGETLGWPVHMLGWGRDLWELGRISRYFGNRIRSTDSTKPFVYALAGISLASEARQGRTPEYPKRSSTYFQSRMDDDTVALSIENMQFFDLMTHGLNGPNAALRVKPAEEILSHHWLLTRP